MLTRPRGRAIRPPVTLPPLPTRHQEDILPYCREPGIGVLVCDPLAHSLLSSKMTSGQQFDEDDWRARSGIFQKNLDVVEELERFAGARGHAVPQLAVTWALANSVVDVAIVGARRPGQLGGTAPAAGFDLSDEDLQEIEIITWDAVMVGGPSPEKV